MKLTKKELLNIKILILQNIDSSKLQKNIDISYSELEIIVNKINEEINSLERKESPEKIKDRYLIKRENNIMVIVDNITNHIYCINDDLVYQGDIAPYQIENRKDAILDIKTWIAESSEALDKSLMKEDLQILETIEDDYVLSNYNNEGFYTKNNPVEFNKVCIEIIETYKEYIEKKKMSRFTSRVMS